MLAPSILIHANQPDTAYDCTPTNFTSTLTWYDNAPLGLSACHYSDPTLPGGATKATQFYAAVATHLYDDNLCGACALITDNSNGNTVTVMITDECPAASNPTHCSSGSNHLDLSQNAFGMLEPTGVGVINSASWHVVPCPLNFMNVKGQNGANLTYQFKSGASSGWATLIIRDYIMPIRSVEYCSGPGTGCSAAAWQRAYNGWVPSGSWSTIYLRITDKGGNIGNFGPINCCSPLGTDAKGETASVYGNFPAGQMPGCGPAASPTPTRTPIGTLTNTPNWTKTATPTLTPLPADCPAVFNSFETLTVNGTWAGTNATRTLNTTVPAAIWAGSASMKAQITVPAAFNDQIAQLTGFSPTLFTGVNRITIDVYVDPAALIWSGASTYHRLTIYADSSVWAKYERSIVVADQDLVAGMNHLSFTLNWANDGTHLLSTDTLTKIYLIMNQDGQQNGNIYFDNMVLHTDAACPPPSPTPTATRSSTPTPLSTSTFTGTSTRTSSPTLSSTPVVTSTFTGTSTLTRSPTPSVTLTRTPSSTLTNTVAVSPTFTGTSTFTHTPTSSYSATSTASLTRSPTSTSSSTIAVTFTFTGTPTFTRSATPTSSPTMTSTPTRSPTSSITPTFSASPSPLPGSPTFTMTNTVFISSTPSRTSTSSSTSTRTSTPSNTLTVTPSRTVTPSLTTSPSSSVTNTPVPGSATFSPTVTSTSSVTRSPTSSVTSTITLTRTGTITTTSTPSDTPLPGSPTFSFTLTPFISPTQTLTSTPTLSATSSKTPTSTLSVTPSFTSTLSFTLTDTPVPGSPTVTMTLTATRSNTPLPTLSFSPTRTVSATPTASPTGTVTPTATGTSSAPPATATSISTATAQVHDGPNEIEKHGVAPSPNDGTGNLAVKLLGSVDSVELRVYSKSMICIGTSRIGHQSPGWCRLPLPAEMATQSSGLYYYRVKSIRNGTSNREPGIGSFMVIK